MAICGVRPAPLREGDGIAQGRRPRRNTPWLTAAPGRNDGGAYSRSGTSENVETAQECLLVRSALPQLSPLDSRGPGESTGSTITNWAARKPAGYRRIAMVSISISAPGRPNAGSGTPVDAPAGSR